MGKAYRVRCALCRSRSDSHIVRSPPSAHAAPLVGLLADDKRANDEVDSYQEVQFCNGGFVYIERAAPKQLPHRSGQKLVVPQTGAVRGMSGFCFITENINYPDDFALPDDADEMIFAWRR